MMGTGVRNSIQCLLVAISIAFIGCTPATTVSIGEKQQALHQLEQMLAPSVEPDEPADASLSRAPDELCERIENILEEQHKRRVLDSSVNAAWQIMHGVVCYGTELEILTPDRGRVPALAYAFRGGLIDGFELSLGDEILPLTRRTGIRARVEPGSYVGQGHPDQWLAICAMAGVPVDTEVIVSGESRTLLDWCRQAQWDVGRNALDEYSWTLIALTHYLPDEPGWDVDDGMTADWELLVQAELSQELDDSPCGGTHRLAGLVRALAAKRRLGLPDSDTWRKAQQTVDSCIANAKSNRNSDGSLSSYYFVRPSKSVDLAAELASAGHLFEFLALALPEDELKQPWVKLAAQNVCKILEQTRDFEMECGGLYHALNGLKIYQQKMRGE